MHHFHHDDRGEKDVGYSKPFRHLEFTSALAAELNIEHEDQLDIQFISALNYTGEERLPDGRIEHYNEAMQYMSLPEGDSIVTREGVIAAVQRCSLVHALYEVISVGDDWKTLCARAMDDGGFLDLYQGGINEKDSWCFRVRNFEHLDLGNNDDPNVSAKEKRYGSNARSMKLEKEGLDALEELMVLFGGKVDLRNPDCKIYAFDGLVHAQKALTRRIAISPKVRTVRAKNRHPRIFETSNNSPAFSLSLLDFYHQPQYKNLRHEYSIGTNCCLFTREYWSGPSRKCHFRPLRRIVCYLVGSRHDCPPLPHSRY